MYAWQEKQDLDSCLNKAKENEPIFVLLGRDKAAHHTVRLWVAERVKSGLNDHHDKQITEALELADKMEEYARQRIR